MAHDTPTISAKPRERTGTRYARRLRDQGRLPAIIYGHKTDPMAVHLDHKEMISALRHGTHVMHVTVEGGGTEMCLVKDLQYGYLGDNVIHLDFTRVDADEEVEVHVHIRFVGEPEGAKHPRAILSHEITELMVKCKVNAIPEDVRIDLNRMEGSVLTVGEISLPDGISCPLEPSTPIVVITHTQKEEAVGEEVEVEAATAPEVITEARPKDDEESSE